MLIGTSVATVGAGVGWAAALLDILRIVDLTPEESQFALAAAITLTALVMLCVRRRPLGQAYDMGYEHGRRDALRRSNGPGGGKLVHIDRRLIEPLCEKQSG